MNRRFWPELRHRVRGLLNRLMWPLRRRWTAEDQRAYVLEVAWTRRETP